MEKNISQQIQVLINQFNAKNFEHVISKAKVILKKNPEYLILYNLIGSSYQNIGRYEDAINFFKNGLKLEPRNLAIMNNLAMAHKNVLEYKTAEKLYLKIIELDSAYINAYINLGNLKRDLNQFNNAINLYEKASKITNKNPIVYYSLALAHQGLGNFDRACEYAEKTLDLNPNFTRADHLISQSRKYHKEDNHYKKMKSKINDIDIKDFEKIDLLFALAKAEEDIGNIKDSFNFFLQGNKLRKKIIKYNISEEIKLLQDIKDRFDQFKNDNLFQNQENNMIFILGMPRSGTSLVEQIVTSHSQVFGGGELPILSNIIKKNFINNNQLIKNEFSSIINDPNIISQMQIDYKNFISNFNHTEKYITDKAPLNYRWIGFIKIIFPNAKIIHCKREPKNNCLSMFKNLFEGGLNFTYDEMDLVKYYKKYEDLMSFWKKKYENTILEVRYEDLINNNEKEVKKIIKFCNLEWEDGCLSFHKNKTPIKTMSTAQARQPIYKSSLNSFEKFKDYLKFIEQSL